MIFNKTTTTCAGNFHFPAHLVVQLGQEIAKRIVFKNVSLFSLYSRGVGITLTILWPVGLLRPTRLC